MEDINVINNVISESSDFSMLSLFLQADYVVKSVNSNININELVYNPNNYFWYNFHKIYS